jgi:hypothetical protein
MGEMADALYCFVPVSSVCERGVGMKLYQCWAHGIDYEICDFVVAETEEEAEEKFKRKLDEEGTWYAGTVRAYEVKIDGYKITVTKE